MLQRKELDLDLSPEEMTAVYNFLEVFQPAADRVKAQMKSSSVGWGIMVSPNGKEAGVVIQEANGTSHLLRIQL